MIVKDRQALINQLTRKEQELENRIEYRYFYNARNIIATGLIKGFKVADFALPFLASAVIVGSTPQVKKNPPFHQDLITRQAFIETLDTSNGIHAYHLSYKENFQYETNYFEGYDDIAIFNFLTGSKKSGKTFSLLDINFIIGTAPSVYSQIFTRSLNCCSYNVFNELLFTQPKSKYLLYSAVNPQHAIMW